MMNFLRGIILGFLNGTRGRGFANEYGWVFGKGLFVGLFAIIFYLNTGDFFKVIGGVLAVLTMFWTGTGQIMMIVHGQAQKEREFWPIDFIVQKLTKLYALPRAGQTANQYRFYAIIYTTILGLLMTCIYCLVSLSFSWWNLLFLIQGIALAPLKYLKHDLKFWLYAEIIMGVIWSFAVV